jgi:hypothetical protein
MLLIAAADGTPNGLDLTRVLPAVRSIPNGDSAVELRCDTGSVKATGEQMQAGWERTKPTADCPKSVDGKHHVVRDDDAPQHGCCQACDKVVYLG